MKKILDILFAVISIVIGMPILLIVCIGYLLYVPIEIIRYHRMPYYKDLKNKYVFFITFRDVVKIYNYIASEKWPVEYFKNVDYEYFIKDGTVLMCGWSYNEFEKVDNEWYFILDDEDDKRISAQEIIELDRQLLKPEHKDLPAKILMVCDKTDIERFELAKECPHFYCINI